MTDKERLITDIINRLEILTLQTNILSRELRERREQDSRRPTRTGRVVFDGPAPSTHGTTRHAYQTKTVHVHPTRTQGNEHDFQPGDRVVVTNGNKRGLEGRVFQVARRQITFRDQTGYTFVRKYTNLRRINDNPFSS
jgi:hypothetical protein